MSIQDKPLKNFAALSGLGVQMGVIIYVLVRIGKWLDAYLDLSKKIFVVIGAITGVALGLYVVLKQLKKIQNR